MKYDGFIEKQLGGKLRGLKFGMNAWFILSEEMKEELGPLETKIASLQGKDYKDMSTEDILLLLRYNRGIVYAGLKAHDLSKGLEIDYNFYTVNDWCDDMEAEDFFEIINFALSTKALVLGKGQAKAAEKETA